MDGRDRTGLRPLVEAELQQVAGGEIRAYPIGTFSTGYGVRTDFMLAQKQVLQAAYDATHPWMPGR